MTTRILVVDDEPRFIRLVEANLTTEGYQVITAPNGQAAVDMTASEKPDLVMMDVLMPVLDGFGAVERIREFSSVPIIMLTAKGEENDRVQGLNLGADDYIVKPFSASELLARVHAVLRRAKITDKDSGQSVFSHHNLSIDYARAEVSLDEKPVFLSATEYRLLLQFAHNVGQTLTPEELLSNVWGPEYQDDKEILWVCISRLRQKLEEQPKKPVHIVTRSGVGYTMPG
ncbi:MAG: response regulator transcription factor [Anaerolineae bacterium]|nr:response regulator transcription factor [Anaerolineae bacterium]